MAERTGQERVRINPDFVPRAAYEAVVSECVALRAELARTPVRLTAEEAETVREAIWYGRRGEVNHALALLSGGDKDTA